MRGDSFVHEITIIRAEGGGGYVARCNALNGFFISANTIDEILQLIPSTVESIYKIQKLNVKTTILPQQAVVVFTKSQLS